MTTKPTENLNRETFPEERISNTDALAQLETATGIARATLLDKIPELKRGDLAFGVRWASKGFDDSEIGRHNSEAVRDYVLLSIPELNVAGDKKNDVSGINRSYYINTETFDIVGAQGFYEAEETLWGRPDVDMQSNKSVSI
jgi:hypothetical protein